MAVALFVGFVVLFCYGVERQRRIRRGQRQLGQLAELLLLRRAFEISASARSELTNSPEAQPPQP
jgi:hypothetical protein